jgi:hypothetical protein
MATGLEELSSAMVIIIIVALVIAVGAILLSGFQTNASSTTSTPILGDAVVVHSGGTYTVYNASSHTNTNNGIALLNAVSNAVSGDMIYLNAGTYNIGANAILLSATPNLRIYGSGKFKTNIISSTNGAGIMQCGINSIVADLGIYVNQPSYSGQYSDVKIPFGAWTGSDNYGNCTARNVYIQGYSDGVYFSVAPITSGNNNIYLYNITSNTMWDALEMNSGAAAIKNVYVFDSNLIVTNTIDNVLHEFRGEALFGSNIITVNSRISVIGPANGIINGTVLETGALSLYGVNVIATNGCGVTNYDLSPGILAVNSTTSYSNPEPCVTNVINIGATPYGSYTYRKSPRAAPTTTGTGQATVAIGLGLTALAQFGTLLPLIALTIVAAILIWIVTIALLSASKGDRY